uniref:ELM2 domain-containing protein n=1 Tax=Strongyloides papillosus TaxID=174720 RepID=A0A0N5CDL6_STREA
MEENNTNGTSETDLEPIIESPDDVSKEPTVSDEEMEVDGEELGSDGINVNVKTRSRRKENNEPFLALDVFNGNKSGTNLLLQIKQEIRLGSQYQVDESLLRSLDIMYNNPKLRVEKKFEGEILWNPNDPKFDDEKTLNVIDNDRKYEIPLEKTLYKIQKMNFDYDKILEEIPVKEVKEEIWTPEEIIQFKYCFQRFGKQFHKYKVILTTKPTKAVIERYFNYKYFDKYRSSYSLNEPLSHVDMALKLVDKPFLIMQDEAECSNCKYKTKCYIKLEEEEDVLCEYCYNYKKYNGELPDGEKTRHISEESFNHDSLKIKVNGVRRKLLEVFKSNADQNDENYLFPLSEKSPLQRHREFVQKHIEKRRFFDQFMVEYEKLWKIINRYKTYLEGEIKYPHFGTHFFHVVNRELLPSAGRWVEWESSLQECIFDLCQTFQFNIPLVERELRGLVSAEMLAEFIKFYPRRKL